MRKHMFEPWEMAIHKVNFFLKQKFDSALRPLIFIWEVPASSPRASNSCYQIFRTVA
jgi:hypothetical protein